MLCLTNNEVSEWLRARAVQEDPCHQDEGTPSYYLQFYSPTRHAQSDAFCRHYFKRIVCESESLIHITDWGLYQPSEMIAVMGIRHSFGEGRILIEAPGHSIDSNQPEVGISLFSLSTSFAWSSYLYCTRERTTLYNWEGAIFDFWTDCASALAEMKTLLKEFDLTQTKDAEQGGGGNSAALRASP